MGSWNISPRYTNQKLTTGGIEDKIDVFEDQIEGWTLVHAKALCADNYYFKSQAGFAVLTLVCPYFEAIESYIRGEESKNKSREFFRHGLLRVFPRLRESLREKGWANVDHLAGEIAATMYEELRCGLFHEGGTKSRLVIREGSTPIECMVDPDSGHVGSILVDPFLFLDSVEEHWKTYIDALRDSTKVPLRTTFERFFDLRLSRPMPVLPPSLRSGQLESGPQAALR